MTTSMRILALSFLMTAVAVAQSQSTLQTEGDAIIGQRIPADDLSTGYIESSSAVVARDAAKKGSADELEMNRGVWIVPSRRATYHPKSGEHNLVNKYGDTEMGIAFNRNVNVEGFYIAGQSTVAVWAKAIRVIGYQGEIATGETEWFHHIDETPAWVAVNLEGVDRIVIEAIPSSMGVAFYGIDDIEYAVLDDDGREIDHVLLDFEDCAFHQDLSGTDYAGLNWEFGSSESSPAWIVPAPADPPDIDRSHPATPQQATRGIDPQISPPNLQFQFEGVIRGDAGSSASPPDTHGSIGPNHFVETVNRNFAVYDRNTGDELMNVFLGSFLPGSNGDPRVIFDHHSGRWVVIVSDFDSRIYIAVSLTDDPMGSWYKSSFRVSQEFDTGCFPDYPTLGVDDDGIYVTAYMVGCGMSIFVIEKAPLLEATPGFGAISAFRGLSGGGAIQPAVTFGDSGGEWFVSYRSSTTLRIQQLMGSITNPVLQNYAPVSIAIASFPPDAPALGSSVPLDTVGNRIMNAVYRNGSIWACNTVYANGRSGCQWYEIDATTRLVVQQGLVDSPSLYYFFPSIAVNATGHVAMGFSGSSASEYASTYYTGRSPSDPPGMMAPPVLYRAGQAPLNVIDGAGRNRFGDYSFTSIDPQDDQTFWTIQEFAHSTNIWGTEFAVLQSSDCNGNSIEDADDIAMGTSLDCNANAIPDECEYDCNDTGIPDDCDVANETSEDCNGNITPDECESDCNGTGLPDDCDLANQTSVDCNSNGAPDECELIGNDCNFDDIPDDCQLAELVESLTQPTDLDACLTSNTQIAVSSPLSGLTYQWKKLSSPLVEGVDAIGTQTNTLTILNVEPFDAGLYYCEINKGCIETATEMVLLTVLPEFSIVQQPAALSTTCTGNTVAIGVDAVGPELTYQWLKDGSPLQEQPGKFEDVDTSILRIINANTGDLAEYSCIVGDACGASETTTSAFLQFGDALFDVQPVNQCVSAGETAVYTASASAAPFSIFRQWHKDGAPLIDGGNVSGAFTDTLTIQNVSPSDEGSYSLRALSLGASCVVFSESVNLELDSCLCPTPGDMDSDGDLDLADLHGFLGCFESNVADSTECACANLDATNDTVDLDDWAAYANLITGP